MLASCGERVIPRAEPPNGARGEFLVLGNEAPREAYFLDPTSVATFGPRPAEGIERAEVYFTEDSPAARGVEPGFVVHDVGVALRSIASRTFDFATDESWSADTPRWREQLRLPPVNPNPCLSSGRCIEDGACVACTFVEPATPVPPAPPRFECPADWHRITDGDHQFCRPFPSPPILPCPRGEGRFPGEDCEPIAPVCPPDRFANVTAQDVVYLTSDPTAPNGDGTRAAPFNSIRRVIDLIDDNGFSGTVVLDAGPVPHDFGMWAVFRRPIEIVGACGDTEIEGNVRLAAPATIRRATVIGRIVADADLTLEEVRVDWRGAGFPAIRSPGRNVRLRSVHVESSTIAVETGTGAVDADRLYIAPGDERGVWTRGSDSQFLNVFVHGRGKRAIFVEGAEDVVLRNVAFSQMRGAAFRIEGGSADIDNLWAYGQVAFSVIASWQEADVEVRGAWFENSIETAINVENTMESGLIGGELRLSDAVFVQPASGMAFDRANPSITVERSSLSMARVVFLRTSGTAIDQDRGRVEAVDVKIDQNSGRAVKSEVGTIVMRRVAITSTTAGGCESRTRTAIRTEMSRVELESVAIDTAFAGSLDLDTTFLVAAIPASAALNRVSIRGTRDCGRPAIRLRGANEFSLVEVDVEQDGGTAVLVEAPDVTMTRTRVANSALGLRLVSTLDPYRVLERVRFEGNVDDYENGPAED